MTFLHADVLTRGDRVTTAPYVAMDTYVPFSCFIFMHYLSKLICFSKLALVFGKTGNLSIPITSLQKINTIESKYS